MLYWTHFDVWMQGPDNCKTDTKETGGNRNVFVWRMQQVSQTAKKSNETVFQEADATRSLINRIRECQATFFGHVTTGMIEGKRSMKRFWMD